MKVPYTNDTDQFSHIGPVTIAPHMTRDVEESHIPGYKKPGKVVEPEPDPFADLLEHNVQTVVASLGTMELADIEKLGEMEQTGAARKGVLSAIAEELLKRAEKPAPATETQSASETGTGEQSSATETTGEQQ